MNLRTGVDLIEIQRIGNAITRHGKRFTARIFTPNELALAGDDLASLTARFAANDAVAIALGCCFGAVSWKEIEILRDDSRAPVLFLHGAAQRLADKLNLHTWSLSLSHTQTHAVAFVVAIGK